MKTQEQVGNGASTNPGLVCPACKSSFTAEGESLRCVGCGKSWPIIRGVPHFIPPVEYWGEVGITREALIEITRQMETLNWRDVILNYADPAVRQYSKYIGNLGRACWQSLVPLNERSVVLDGGAGFGAVSHALSRNCGHVYSLERVEERVEFLRLRFIQEKCDNITIVRSDLDTLPFSENSFDLIVLNGVLEWLPFSRKQENPRKAQLHYLRALLRLLKPGGTLYVGIENRFSYELLLGSPDQHIGVKYVAVLPRWLADVVCKFKLGDRYRPYLYSWRGYKRLFAEAGFEQLRGYVACPHYTDPIRVVSLAEDSIHCADSVWRTKNPLSKVAKKIMLELDLLKYFCMGYVLLARKEDPSKSGHRDLGAAQSGKPELPSDL